MRLLTADDLDDVARGAAVLGSGGGGNAYLGSVAARRTLREHGPVELVLVEELPADALVLPLGMMGAPMVGIERLSAGREPISALRALEGRLGRHATHLMPIEAGGANAMTPIRVAAQLGLPLVDADGMGRAFPELQMALPALVGIPAAPLALADLHGNRVVLDTVNDASAERLARALTRAMGYGAAVVMYPMSGDQVAGAVAEGTISMAGSAGRALREARAAHTDATEALERELGAVVLTSGRVTDVEHILRDGFARGTARIRTEDGTVVTVDFQNEFLLARTEGPDGSVLAATPDLICLLDEEEAAPVGTEALRYGHRITLVAIPCHPLWHSPDGMALVGPRRFGYDVDPPVLRPVGG